VQIIKKMNAPMEWIQSYVTEDKIFCVFEAPDKEIVKQHAKAAAFPADYVYEVSNVIDPTWAVSDRSRVTEIVRQLFSSPDCGLSVSSDDLVGIRPCGQAVNRAGIREISRENTIKCAELWSLEDIRFLAGGVACVVSAKSHHVYTSKGVEHDDIANNTIVLEKLNEEWKVVRWQQSVGVVPAVATPKRV
jgi:hypothetical protein